MSDSGREGCKIGEVRINMNRVEIFRGLRVRFVSQRSIKRSGNIRGIQRVAVSDSSRERCKIGEVRINMNRVEIFRGF